MKNEMQTVTIELGERSYPIYIGSGLLTESGLIQSHIQSQQVLVVSNETVAPLFQAKLQSALADLDARFVILPDGESHKNLTILNTIYDALLKARFDRNCCLVALGGGVVGDMAGYAAASYQRGVNFIQIPTTLLAQVDSSVGGKTGVNHPLGKNMIGAFHQPQCVIADTDTLSTLPDAELRAGLAEVIKHGLILDNDFFTWLESNLATLLDRNADALAYAIRRSCEIKSAVVTQDEHERGQRALLNLGHTFGHAIETTLGYGKWLHGEAVSAGMAMAMDTSCRLGWMAEDQRTRAVNLLDNAGLPIAPPPEITPDQFLDCMLRDKKTRDGTLRLVLLEAIGKSLVTHDFDEAALNDTLAHYYKSA